MTLMNMDTVWGAVRDTAAEAPRLYQRQAEYFADMAKHLGSDHAAVAKVIDDFSFDKKAGCHRMRIYGWPVAIYSEFVRGGAWSGNLLDCRVRFVLNPEGEKKVIFHHKIDSNGVMDLPINQETVSKGIGTGGVENVLALVAYYVYTSLVVGD